MWQRDGLKSEGHLSYVQRLEQRQGFREVGTDEGWWSLVGLVVVAETWVWAWVLWVLMGEGRTSVLTLVLVGEVSADGEEKRGPSGR